MKSLTRWTAKSSPSAMRSSSTTPYRRPTGRASPEATRSAARARSRAGRTSRRACAIASPAATTSAASTATPTLAGVSQPRCGLLVIASAAQSTTTAAAATPNVDVSRRRRMCSVSSFEPEPDAAHGGDEMRVVRVVAELATEPGHVHVEGLRRSPPLAVPDLAHDLVPGHDLARLGHQQIEQVELLGREIELGGAEPGPARVRVDPHALH